MAIANLQTLDILKKARIAKDASGGAVSTTDLQAGGLLRPEQGGRTARLDMQKRKLRKPVLLGKSCSEIGVEKAKDAGGHGSEKRGGGDIVSRVADKLKGKERVAKHPKTGKWHGIDSVLRTPISEVGHDNPDDAKAEWRNYMARGSLITADSSRDLKDIEKAKDALGHGSEKRNGRTIQQLSAEEHHKAVTETLGWKTGGLTTVEHEGKMVPGFHVPAQRVGGSVVPEHTRKFNEKGDMIVERAAAQTGERKASLHGEEYHFNDETQRWHDKNGEPTHNQGIHDKLNAQVVGSEKRDSAGTLKEAGVDNPTPDQVATHKYIFGPKSGNPAVEAHKDHLYNNGLTLKDSPFEKFASDRK